MIWSPQLAIEVGMERVDDERPPKKLKASDHDPKEEKVATVGNPNGAGDGTLPSSSSSLALPPGLELVDFSQPVSWGKHFPYSNEKIALTPLDEPPVFTDQSPALCHYVHAISGRARACTIHLAPQPGQQSMPSRPVPTPIFMPVGTKGCLKALTFQELTQNPALQCPIILANTYHLAIQPGTELIDEMGGLHAFQGLSNVPVIPETATDTKQVAEGKVQTEQETTTLPYNLLTDSGGFQMVSLVKLSAVSEDGVSFENPYKQEHGKGRPDLSIQNNSKAEDEMTTSDKNEGTEPQQLSSEQPERNDAADDSMLLLRPEDSIRHQHHIRANIIMALDDVVSSVQPDQERMVTATHRTLRWYDRCYQAHHSAIPIHSNETATAMAPLTEQQQESPLPLQYRNPAQTQNLFPIVQGGLDAELGGLREQCLAGFRHREIDLQYVTPGYAIGGLAGGEDKDDFWRIVDQCCKALPDNKPRYLMGVGYPLDLVVCTALGVDMYDCVYPTRTARFGVALVPGRAPGTLRLKGNDCSSAAASSRPLTTPDESTKTNGMVSPSLADGVIQDGCHCPACHPDTAMSRSRLQRLFKAGNPVAVELLTQHNIAYMMSLVRNMRQSILDDRFADFAVQFVKEQYPGGKDDIPKWVVDALTAAGIPIGE